MLDTQSIPETLNLAALDTDFESDLLKLASYLETLSWVLGEDNPHINPVSLIMAAQDVSKRLQDCYYGLPSKRGSVQ